MCELKICKLCKKEKSIMNFSKKYKTKDGVQKHQPICKSCFNENDSIRRNKEKEKKKEYDKIYYENNKEKILNNKKIYHILNKNTILDKKKQYREIPENKERYVEYRKNNKDKYKEGQKRYRENNPHIIVWRSMIYRTLNHLGKLKENKTIDLLGYSALELKEHIEKQFLEGMSWENHGEWEIDHIKPLSLFGKNASPSEVNSLLNLQPLWKIDNRKKYNKNN